MKEKGGLDFHVEEKTVTKKGSGEISDKRVIAQKQPGLYAVAYHRSEDASRLENRQSFSHF